MYTAMLTVTKGGTIAKLQLLNILCTLPVKGGYGRQESALTTPGFPNPRRMCDRCTFAGAGCFTGNSEKEREERVPSGSSRHLGVVFYIGCLSK